MVREALFDGVPTVADAVFPIVGTGICGHSGIASGVLTLQNSHATKLIIGVHSLVLRVGKHRARRTICLYHHSSYARKRVAHHNHWQWHTVVAIHKQAVFGRRKRARNVAGCLEIAFIKHARHEVLIVEQLVRSAELQAKRAVEAGFIGRCAHRFHRNIALQREVAIAQRRVNVGNEKHHSRWFGLNARRKRKRSVAFFHGSIVHVERFRLHIYHQCRVQRGVSVEVHAVGCEGHTVSSVVGRVDIHHHIARCEARHRVGLSYNTSGHEK